MDVHGRPEQRQEIGDVDWEGEWRWHDARWASNTAIVAVCCAVPGVSWAFGSKGGIRLTVVALVLAGLLIWLNTMALNKLMRETGLTHRRLAVVMRLARRESIPRDPVARRAMAHLIRFQNSKLAGARWMRPVAAALFLVLAVAQLLLKNYVFGVALLVGAGYLASRFGVAARVQARQDRLEARLAPEFGPPAGPASRD